MFRVCSRETSEPEGEELGGIKKERHGLDYSIWFYSDDHDDTEGDAEGVMCL